MSNQYSSTVGLRESKYHRELRLRIIRHFNLDELRFLASDLSVDWDALAGETKQRKAQELIEYLSRRKELGKLIALIKHERPSIEWPGFPDGTVVDLRFEYEATGKTQDGTLVEGEGRIEFSHVIDGEYYDDGLAFAEAVQSVADHFYIFQIEKAGHWGLSEVNIRISNLDYSIHIPVEVTVEPQNDLP